MNGPNAVAAMARQRKTVGIVLAAAVCFGIAFGWPVGRRNMRVILDMQTDSAAGIGQLYYAVGDQPFKEPASVLFPLRPGPGSRYAVDLPIRSPKGLSIRIDPTDQPGAQVEIRHLRFEFFRGAKIVVYEAALDALADPAGATVVERGPKRLRLAAVTRDPWIIVQVERLERYTFLRGTVAISLVLLGALLLLICDWGSVRAGLAEGRGLVYAVAFIAIALQGFYFSQKLPIDSPPDEWPHICYVIDVRESGRLIPDRSHRFLLDASGVATDKLVHLSHPAFYYHLCAPFVPKRADRSVQYVANLRHVNLLMALAGVGLFFWIANREKLPLPFHIYFATAMTCVPMLPYLAGAVNNDNLVLLAGGLATWGALDWLGSPPRSRGLIWLGCGVALGLLIKLTAGLHLLFFALLVGAARVWRDRSFVALKGRSAAVFVLLLAAPLAIYAVFYWRHGTPTPSFGHILRPDLRPPENTSLGFYALHFIRKLSLTWTGIFSHYSVLKRSPLESAPLLAPVFLAFVGLFWRDRRRSNGEGEALFFDVMRLALVAGVLLAVVHLWRSYGTYRLTGYLGGIQARYYFSLMPCMLMLSFRPFLRGAHRASVQLGLALLLLGFMLSGVFYYLLRGP